MRIGAFVLSVAGAALLAACGQSGVYYEKTPEQVAGALKAAYLPTHILGEGVERSYVTQPDASTVVTALIGPDGSEVMRFVTTIAAEGTGSRVSTEVHAPEGKNKERASEAMAEHGYAMTLMDGLAKEHVAAAIEGRPFDMTFAAGPMAKGMMGAMPGMQEQINQANASAAEFSRMEQDLAASGGDDSGWADDSSEPAFGEPMDDASGSE